MQPELMWELTLIGWLCLKTGMRIASVASSKDSNSLVQRMQKALTEMNIQVHRLISDITGVTGMSILRAILAGERDCLKLAQLKHPRIKTWPFHPFWCSDPKLG